MRVRGCSVVGLTHLPMRGTACASTRRRRVAACLPKTRIFRWIFTKTLHQRTRILVARYRSLLECSCFAFLVARYRSLLEMRVFFGKKFWTGRFDGGALPCERRRHGAVLGGSLPLPGGLRASGPPGSLVGDVLRRRLGECRGTVRPDPDHRVLTKVGSLFFRSRKKNHENLTRKILIACRERVKNV